MLATNGVVGVIVRTLPLIAIWLEEAGITRLVLVVSSQIVMLPKLPRTIGSSKVTEIDVGGLMLVESSAGENAVGTGGVESMVNRSGVVLPLVLPATSVWVATTECGPSASGVVGV